MVEIRGLNSRQVALCDILWNLNTGENVQRFMSALPEAEKRECQTLLELMKLAFIDEIDSVDDAVVILEKFRLGA